MPNIKIDIHNRNLKTRLESVKDWNISQQDKKDIHKFLEAAKIGRVNKGKKISETRLIKYLDLFKPAFTFFNKPVSQITIKDMEKFEKALTSDEINKQNNKPFSAWTKTSMKRALIIYLRWKLKPEKYVKLTEWLDTKPPKQTPDYLKEQEIEKLFKSCKNDKERYLIAVLFDSGARAEEFFNIRYEDIQLPKENENYVKITLKAEYSKTEGRTISLYWKHSLNVVRDYFQEREQEGIKSNEAVFNDNYDNMRQFLYRIGLNVLGKKLNFHLFRHSSATYYASKLNRQELCYRYGWKFSSNMPDTYISRAGMVNKELDEKFKATELEQFKKEFERERFDKNKEIQTLKQQMKKVINSLNDDVLKEWDTYADKHDASDEEKQEGRKLLKRARNITSKKP